MLLKNSLELNLIYNNLKEYEYLCILYTTANNVFYNDILDCLIENGVKKNMTTDVICIV